MGPEGPGKGGNPIRAARVTVGEDTLVAATRARTEAAADPQTVKDAALIKMMAMQRLSAKQRLNRENPKARE